MLRVVHCIYDDPENPWVAGGGSRRVREIYARLAGRVEATVVRGRYPGIEDHDAGGIRYLSLGAARPYALSRATYAWRVANLLRAGDFDVGVLDFSVYTPAPLPRRPNVGMVVHMLHGPSAPARWGVAGGRLLQRVERALIRRAHWLCVTSQQLKSKLQRISPGADVSVVPSGVADEFFAVDRQERDYLLCYGRFDIFQKGLDLVLAAFRELAVRHPELRLRIAGRGKDAAELRRRVGAEPHAQRIIVHESPTRDEVLRLMGGALLLLAPSRAEGLPMAPAEAMAAGLPVVATEVGAFAETVQPPAGGVLVPPDDVGAVIEAVERYLDDERHRQETSASARSAARRFSWDTVADRHLVFLQRIAAARREPARHVETNA